MGNKIAVFLGANKKTADLYSVCSVKIYERFLEEWLEVSEFPFMLKNESSAEEMRSLMKSLILKLDNCKIIIVKELIGIPYHILDKEGFIICEAEEFSFGILDAVYNDFCVEKEEEEKAEEIYVPTCPQPMDDMGNYFLDFNAVQKYKPEVSSKKALLPFFSNELFLSLTLICSHIMPWLDNFFEEHNLEYSHKREDGLYTLYITHKKCKC